MGNNYRKLAGNACQEYVGLRGYMVTNLSSGDEHVVLEVIDGSFHDGCDFIEGMPFIRIPLNAGEHAEVHVFVSVSGTPFFGGAAGRPTVHLTCGLSGRTICPGQHALFHGSARHISCPGRSLSGRWVAVSIATNFWDGAFIPWVIGDLCF